MLALVRGGTNGGQNFALRRMEILEPLGPDTWLLPCPRALDHTPPGDWTLALRRDGQGRVTEIELGCWLARKLIYTRTG